MSDAPLLESDGVDSEMYVIFAPRLKFLPNFLSYSRKVDQIFISLSPYAVINSDSDIIFEQSTRIISV
jgi:hypothetical protein